MSTIQDQINEVVPVGSPFLAPVSVDDSPEDWLLAVRVSEDHPGAHKFVLRFDPSSQTFSRVIFKNNGDANDPNLFVIYCIYPPTANVLQLLNRSL